MKDSSSVSSNTDDSFVDVPGGVNNPNMSDNNNNNPMENFIIKIGVPNNSTSDGGETKEDAIKYCRLRLSHLIPEEKKNYASSSFSSIQDVCYQKLLEEFTARLGNNTSTTTTTNFTYHDGDGDLCVVSCTHDLVEAIQQAIQDGSYLLKLHVASSSLSKQEKEEENGPSTTTTTTMNGASNTGMGNHRGLFQKNNAAATTSTANDNHGSKQSDKNDPSVTSRILRAMEGPSKNNDPSDPPPPQRLEDLEEASPELMVKHLLEDFCDHQTLEFSPAFFCDEEELNTNPMTGNDIWVHYRIPKHPHQHYKSRFLAMDDLFLDLTTPAEYAPTTSCDSAGMGMVQCAIPSVFLGRIVEACHLSLPEMRMDPPVSFQLDRVLVFFDPQQSPMVRFYSKKDNGTHSGNGGEGNKDVEITELEPRLPLTEVLENPEYRHFYKITGVFEAREEPVTKDDNDEMPPPPPMGYFGLHEYYDDHPPPPPQEMSLSLQLVEVVLFEAHDHVLEDLMRNSHRPPHHRQEPGE